MKNISCRYCSYTSACAATNASLDNKSLQSKDIRKDDLKFYTKKEKKQ